MTYNALNGLAPSYMSSMLSFYQPSRTLHSSSQGNLVEKRSKSKKTGDRAYSVCAPKLWNCLPSYIKESDSVESFKSALKTLFFRKAFN